MVKCCHKERDTCFCPDCGVALQTKGATIDGLLAHLRSHTKSQATALENLKRDHDNATTDAWRLEPRLERRQRAMNKWQIWLDAVLALIAAAEDGGGT